MKVRILVLFVLLTSLTLVAQRRGGGGGGGASRSSSGRSSGATTRASDPSKVSPQDALKNPRAAAPIQKLFPRGMNAKEACMGFKNMGDCLTEVYLSQDLEVSFEDLKAKTTGKGSQKLDKVLQELKPDINAKDEIKKAQKRAQQDLRGEDS